MTCLRNICSSLTAVNLGDACNADSQCPTASTGSVYCRSFECGGYRAYCSTADGIYPGPSPQCRSDCELIPDGTCRQRPTNDLLEQIRVWLGSAHPERHPLSAKLVVYRNNVHPVSAALRTDAVVPEVTVPFETAPQVDRPINAPRLVSIDPGGKSEERH